MGLRERIQADLKVAMKAGEKGVVGTLRMLQAALKNREIELRRPLEDAEETAIVQTAIKQRKDSRAQYEAGGRQDLADQEKFEIEVIQAYLPPQLSDEALERIVDAAVSETGATGMKDMGAVMKCVLARCAGQADGSTVSAKVREKLA
ncbi:MAG: GatB/YqeY domain-containing protein [Leptospirillia bacterium]